VFGQRKASSLQRLLQGMGRCQMPLLEVTIALRQRPGGHIQPLGDLGAFGHCLHQLAALQQLIDHADQTMLAQPAEGLR